MIFQNRTIFKNLVKSDMKKTYLKIKGGGSLRPVLTQFRFRPKNSEKLLKYLLAIRSQSNPKRTTLITPIHPEHSL